jgi:hypothetical protein
VTRAVYSYLNHLQLSFEVTEVECHVLVDPLCGIDSDRTGRCELLGRQRDGRHVARGQV